MRALQTTKRKQLVGLALVGCIIIFLFALWASFNFLYSQPNAASARGISTTHKQDQVYLDAPDTFNTSSNMFMIGNSHLTTQRIYTVGLTLENQGTTPITLSTITPVGLPRAVKLVGTAIVRPEDNHNVVLGTAQGFPPVYQEGKAKTLKPYIIHPVSQAILQTQQYVQGAVALQATQEGAYIVKGYIVTLKIGNQWYKRYIAMSTVLCVQITQQTCDTTFQQAQTTNQ